jgi:hypothetical protein
MDFVGLLSLSTILTLLWIGSAVSVPLIAKPCKGVLSVEIAIRNAPKLDGKSVCLAGIVRPIEGTTFLIHEITSPARSGAAAKSPAIGIVDWSPETGTEESDYRPESFRMLEAYFVGQQNSGRSLRVVFRGMLMYKRDLFRRLDERLPPDLLYDSVRGLSYSVEFVLLEVLSVTPNRSSRN